jgi:glycolate oxidase FAD binding subunit
MSAPAPGTLLDAAVHHALDAHATIAADRLDPVQRHDLSIEANVARVRPRGIDEVTACLRIASEHRLHVVPLGGGTALARGFPTAPPDLLLDLGGLDRIVRHDSDDFVVEVQAGCTLKALQTRLLPAGQWLPILPPGGERATLGGLVASAATSLAAAAEGTLRAHLLGIEVILADGTRTRAGGRVVKNVAGYDLMKLYHGCQGTLAVITQLTFRLRPLPALDRILVARTNDPAAVAAIAPPLTTLSLPFTAAHDLRVPGEPTRLVVRLQGSRPAVEAQTLRAEEILARCAEQIDRTDLGDPPSESPQAAALAAVLERGPVPASASFRLHGRPSQLCTMHAALAALPCAADLTVLTDLQRGVVHARIDPDDEAALLAALRRLRGALAEEQIVLTLEAGSRTLRRALPAFEVVPGVARLQQRIQRQFDPQGILSRGRMQP